jgi:elongation factor G
MANQSENMGVQSDRPPRAVAICGPYLSGKTSLTESLLLAAGAIARKGSARERNMVGDSSPEARARQMSLDVNVATAQFMGETFALLDCPGSVEFRHDTACALMVADAAVVVCDPDPARVPMLMPLLRLLEERHIPHLIFINKMDVAHRRIREMMAALQGISSRKLVLRQVPIRKSGKGGAEEIDGYVDLISERAYRYQPGKPSALIEMPSDVASRESEARRELLESLADYDDKLLEQLLEDVAPDRGLLYRDLHQEFSAELIVPVLFGAAERDHGIQRLWKALRHDVPNVEDTAARRNLPKSSPLAEIFKTQHQPHTGKLSIARIWRGELADGQSIAGSRIAGLFRLLGNQASKQAKAQAGEIVALGRLETLRTGQRLNGGGTPDIDADWPAPPQAVFALAIAPHNRSDDVKLSAALQKLGEEDAALQMDHRADTGELVLGGQGEIHLKTAIDRLASRYNLPVDARPPKVAYRETIRRSTTQHGRHKRQTGGHGQFGDVTLEIHPQPRGAGFKFIDRIVGGAVPRQYIPGVEMGVREYLRQGPLGHPVVDIAVTLTDGAFHTVDSSEQAFKQAARIAMTEGMARCESVLLEPILRVKVAVPSDATAKIQRLLSGRRGQILGYDARAGWTGWDEVSALLPQAEIADLIVEIRSLSMGVGTYQAEFDHLQELTGKLADRVAGQSRVQAAE